MSGVYQAAALFLIINIGVGLIRIFRGPSRPDRLLVVKLFGTTGTAILILFTLDSQDGAYIDLALVFALLAGIIGVAFTRYAQLRSEKRAAEEEDGSESG